MDVIYLDFAQLKGSNHTVLDFAPCMMTSGFPPRSVLCPLFFLLHNNEINANLNHVIVLEYAEEIKLSF